MRQLIIKGGWKAVGVRHMVLLMEPEDAIRKHRDWEKDWQTKAIHHRDVGHVQDA